MKTCFPSLLEKINSYMNVRLDDTFSPGLLFQLGTNRVTFQHTSHPHHTVGNKSDAPFSCCFLWEQTGDGSSPVHSWFRSFAGGPAVSIDDDQRETSGAWALWGVKVEVFGWELRKAWLAVAATCLPAFLRWIVQHVALPVNQIN